MSSILFLGLSGEISLDLPDSNALDECRILADYSSLQGKFQRLNWRKLTLSPE